MSFLKNMFKTSDTSKKSNSNENHNLDELTLLSVKEVDTDFYKKTLTYIQSSSNYSIAVLYDGGPNFPEFDNESDCNFLKFNTIEEFAEWANIPFNNQEVISNSKLYETIINANKFWQITEGELILEWIGIDTPGQMKVWPTEEIVAYPMTKEDMLKSELLLSSNSILPSLRKFFGNGVDWVEQSIIDTKISIKNLLEEKNNKITVSDINAHLKHHNRDEIKKYCKEMYNDREISFAGNGRYFILNEDSDKPNEASVSSSVEVDVEKELEKLKGLLDKGLITQEQYDAKSNELLGL